MTGRFSLVLCFDTGTWVEEVFDIPLIIVECRGEAHWFRTVHGSDPCYQGVVHILCSGAERTE